MRILIMADAVDNQNAGIHFYTKKLIENLLKIDRQNDYSFIHTRNNEFFENQNHHIVPNCKSIGGESYRRLVKIPKLIKEINPDIVLEPCHIGPFRLPKHIKRAVTVHDITPITMPNFHTARGKWVHKIFFKRTLKNASLILTPSKQTKNDLLTNYSITAPIEITHLGIEQADKSTQSSPLQNPYLLYLGTLEPRKDLPTLIDAFLELKETNALTEDYKLVLAGDIGWKSESVLQKANHKDIILTGYLSEEEKSRWLTHARIFVYPSLYEGFGLPPLEAMSREIPVITSSGGSLKELFEKHALIFEPQDKEELKQHIQNLTANNELYQNLKTGGKEYSQNFTWEKTARKTLEAFEKILVKT